MAEIQPELFTIRQIGEEEHLDRKWYAKELVKSKLTPQSNLKFKVEGQPRTEGGKKQSKLKFEGIEKTEWVNNTSFRL